MRYMDGFNMDGLIGFRTDVARRYYAQAHAILPMDGTAFNQMAVLCTPTLNNGCDTAFYYLCSLACKKPFASAMANTVLILEKARSCVLPVMPPLNTSNSVALKKCSLNY